MEEEFALTDEQVEHWRRILITLPLPPFNLPIGCYATIAPREQIVDIAKNLQDFVSKIPVNEKDEEETPNNIIRTRPRRKYYARRR
jgi:hypothetical protein